ncbi:MAG: aldehyde dehydrogenase family protein [Acidobacteriota bacterium]
MALLSINPATGQKIAGYDAMSTAEVEEALEGCHGDFLAWRSTPLGRRAEPLRRAAEILRARRRPLAELMTAEMGKPVLQGEAEAEKCAAVCEYYADRGADFLAEEPLASDAGESFVSFRPLGVILAVMLLIAP